MTSDTWHVASCELNKTNATKQRPTGAIWLGPLLALVGLFVTALFVMASPPQAQAQAACTNDAFEPNDTNETATPLTSGEQVSGQICGNESDRFAFPVEMGETIDISLLHTHADGNLQLILRDEEGNTRAFLVSQTDNEEANFVSSRSGNFVASVFGNNGAENSYDLTITVSPSVCATDPFEPIDVLFARADGDLEIFLFNPDGGFSQEVGFSGGDNELLTFEADRTGDWAFQVLQRTGVVVDYQLLVSAPGIVDDVPPETSITIPQFQREFTTGTLRMIGRASDNLGVSTVRIAIRNNDTRQWLRRDGTQGAFEFLEPAELRSPGSRSTDWNTVLNLPDGRWRAVAVAVDTSGNVDPSPARVFSFDVNTGAAS